MQGRVGSGERKGREAGRRAVEGKPERRKNKVKRGKRKGEGKGRRSRREGKRGAGRGRQRAGRPRSLRSPSGSSLRSLGGSRSSGRGTPRAAEPSSSRGEGQRAGERGGETLPKPSLYCMCGFWEGHRREDGSNDLIFLFFPGTISAQIGRMK